LDDVALLYYPYKEADLKPDYK